MILCIDTRGGFATKDQKKVKVGLRGKGEAVREITAENKYGSQVLLPLIMRLLRTTNSKLQTLQGIEVETGPGSFTGIRVGVSVANALGYALDIPVNGKKIETDLVY